MSATISPDQFPSSPEIDPEFEDIMSQKVTPTDVLAIYQALYKRNKIANIIPNMRGVQELTQNDVRMALQICNEVNKMEERLNVVIVDKDPHEHVVSKTLAGLYRAVMLSVALRGSVAAETNNFWKIGCISMSIVTIVLLVLTIIR